MTNQPKSSFPINLSTTIRRMETNHEERITIALESIAESLETLAKDTKANKELRIQQIEKMNILESDLKDLADNPFGFMKN